MNLLNILKSIFLTGIFFASQAFAVSEGFYKCIDNDILSSKRAALELDYSHMHILNDRVVHVDNYRIQSGELFAYGDTYMLLPPNAPLEDRPLSYEEESDGLVIKQYRFSRLSSEVIKITSRSKYSTSPGEELGSSVLTRISDELFSIRSTYENDTESGSGGALCFKEAIPMS